MKQGFTLVEILMAIGAAAAVAVAATAFLFSVLGHKDQAAGTAIIADQAETIEAMVEAAVRSAKKLTVAQAGRRLEITGEAECLSLVWDEESGRLNYGRSVGQDCEPPAEANEQLTSQKAKLENLNFQIINPDTASRTVKAEMRIAVYKPLWSGGQTFDFIWVNVVDE